MTDAELVIRFVVWRLRVGDLPDDVRDAAARLAASGDYPAVADRPDLWEPWRTSS